MKKRYYFWLVVLALVAGCRGVGQFPQRAMRCEANADGSKVLFFDTTGDHRADYWQVQSTAGRKVELRFDPNTATGQVVRLEEVRPADVPHFIIALDGVPFELVEELYQQGYFRLFYPPHRVISTFPAMTDLAFQRLFGGRQPLSDQATYFDRQANRIVSGDDLYLSGGAADWAKRLDYRISFKWDPLAYAFPEQVFDFELDGMMEVFRKQIEGTHIAYSVATAGLGTQGGREAILKYLRRIDQMCETIVYERKGQVKLTLLADHGHNMSGRGRVTFDEILKDAGYRLTDKLEQPKDVVTVEYGLITYAAFYTKDPAGVAEVLIKDPVTTVACYPQDDHVVVQTLDGKAYVRQRDGRHSYEQVSGDPLELNGIIDKLRQKGQVDAEGYIDDRALFLATVEHEYPDPLYRIWQVFHGLVQQPADLYVCLKDGWVHGSKFFHVMIGGASSTHGSLNRLNSTTFVATMLGDMPPALRPEEVMPALEGLRQPAARQR